MGGVNPLFRAAHAGHDRLSGLSHRRGRAPRMVTVGTRSGLDHMKRYRPVLSFV